MVQFDLSGKDYEDILIFFDNNVKDYANFGVAIDFNADFKYSKTLRDFIYYVLDKNNLNYRWKNRFALLTDEIINNAIEHWSNDKNDKVIFVITFSNDLNLLKVNFEVTSFWKDWEKIDAKTMEKIRKKKIKEGYSSHDSIRWRWLFLIVQQIVDRLYFKDAEDGGLVVGINKNFELE